MYDFIRIEGNEYPLFSFTTDSKYLYQVSFFEAAMINNNIPLYSVTIDCIEKGVKIRDPKIGQTAHKIICEFISENNNCLFSYVCDSDDDKQLLRQRKFNGWYTLYNSGSHALIMYDVNIPNTDIIYYSSIIFDSSIYDHDFINNIYKSEIDTIANHKI